ncbi:glycosyltransferase [uncultured Cedecea sp.]|uniref:glycosyltransferase n=1 Tax=uncultured Cedecea sp. TaxID=988762 RepID=UPI00261680BB|nr:glycosyltransferase [uncultured Cedecea sp.]
MPQELKVAIILSVYKSDSLTFLKEAVDSLINQTYSCIDIFIQVDGWVSDDVKCLLKKYNEENNIFIFYHAEQKGLATRLNNSIDLIIEKGGYEYIARMDSDDISCSNRIETQVKFMSDNIDIDVVGSDVIEISEIGDELYYKKMDSDSEIIMKKIIKKCPLNHPSVMFRTSLFEDGVRYNASLKNTQDYYLWIDLLSAGKKISNINKPLLKFRVDNNFHSRRGFKKAINDLNARCYAFKKLEVLTLTNILHTVLLFLLRISPPFLKKIAYNKFR